jgi:hypothetical protein
MSYKKILIITLATCSAASSIAAENTAKILENMANKNTQLAFDKLFKGQEYMGMLTKFTGEIPANIKAAWENAKKIDAAARAATDRVIPAMDRLAEAIRNNSEFNTALTGTPLSTPQQKPQPQQDTEVTESEPTQPEIITQQVSKPEIAQTTKTTEIEE